MSKIISAIVVVVVIVGGYYFYKQNARVSAPAAPEAQQVNANVVPATDATASAAKEFTMTAYYDSKGKSFSLKSIDVKKGDTVRIKITNTAGTHDFTLDEFGIKKDLPMNQEVVVEFVADKVGQFQYYCSKPGHRAGGQWGTLNVTE